MEQNNSIKKLIVIEQNKDIKLVVEGLEEKQDFYFVSFANDNFEINLNVELKQNANALLHILIFNFNDTKKSIKCNVYYNENYASCFNNVKVVGFNQSITNVQLNAFVKKSSSGNAAYQNISANLFQEARVIGEPNLIIDSNNVKAGHSFNVGTISREILFYLQSRGLKKQQAFELIVQSFFDEVFDNFDVSTKQNYEYIMKDIFRLIDNVKN